MKHSAAFCRWLCIVTLALGTVLFSGCDEPEPSAPVVQTDQTPEYEEVYEEVVEEGEHGDLETPNMGDVEVETKPPVPLRTMPEAFIDWTLDDFRYAERDPSVNMEKALDALPNSTVFRGEDAMLDLLVHLISRCDLPDDAPDAPTMAEQWKEHEKKLKEAEDAKKAAEEANSDQNASSDQDASKADKKRKKGKNAKDEPEEEPAPAPNSKENPEPIQMVRLAPNRLLMAMNLILSSSSSKAEQILKDILQRKIQTDDDNLVIRHMISYWALKGKTTPELVEARIREMMMTPEAVRPPLSAVLPKAEDQNAAEANANPEANADANANAQADANAQPTSNAEANANAAGNAQAAANPVAAQQPQQNQPQQNPQPQNPQDQPSGFIQPQGITAVPTQTSIAPPTPGDPANAFSRDRSISMAQEGLMQNSKGRWYRVTYEGGNQFSDITPGEMSMCAFDKYRDYASPAFRMEIARFLIDKADQVPGGMHEARAWLNFLVDEDPRNLEAQLTLYKSGDLDEGFMRQIDLMLTECYSDLLRATYLFAEDNDAVMYESAVDDAREDDDDDDDSDQARTRTGTLLSQITSDQPNPAGEPQDPNAVAIQPLQPEPMPGMPMANPGGSNEGSHGWFLRWLLHPDELKTYQNLLWSEDLLKMYFKRNPSGITGFVPKQKNNVGNVGGFNPMQPVTVGSANIGARIFTMIPQQSYRELLYKTLASGWNQGPNLITTLGLPNDQVTDIGFLMAIKLQKRWEISDLLQQKTNTRKRSRSNDNNQVNVGGGMMNPNSIMNPNAPLMQQQQQQQAESPEMLAQVAQNWQIEVYRRLLWWNNCFDNSCELKQAVNGKDDEEIKAPADLRKRFQVPDDAEIVAYYTCEDPAFLQENSKKPTKKAAAGKKDLADKGEGDDESSDANDKKDKKTSGASGMMGFGITESIYDNDTEEADSKDGVEGADKDADSKDADSKDAADKDATEKDDALSEDKTDKKAEAADDDEEDDSKEGKKATRKKKLAERRQTIRAQRQKKSTMQAEYMHVRFEAKPQALVKAIQGKMKEARFYETPSGSGVTYGVWLESLYFDKSRQKHVSVDVILTPTDLEAARAANAPNALNKDAEKKKLEEQAKAKAGLKGKSKNNKNAGGIMLDMYVLTMEMDNIVGHGDSKNDAERDMEAEEAEMAEFGFKRDKEGAKDDKDAKDSKKGSRLHRGSRKAATDEKDADDSNAKKKKRTPARSSRKSKG